MKSFETLVKKHEKQIRAIARSWESNKYIRAYDLHDPEDIYQECLIGFWNAYGSYDEDKELSSFKTYAERVVRNHMIDIVRHQKGKVTDSNSDDVVWNEGLQHVDDYEEAPDTLTPVDVRKDIKKALDNILTNEERNLYEMYFVQGLAMEEIAEATGTYKMDVGRKIKKLTQNPKLIEKLSAYRGEQ